MVIKRYNNNNNSKKKPSPVVQNQWHNVLESMGMIRIKIREFGWNYFFDTVISGDVDDLKKKSFEIA